MIELMPYELTSINNLDLLNQYKQNYLSFDFKISNDVIIPQFVNLKIQLFIDLIICIF